MFNYKCVSDSLVGVGYGVMFCGTSNQATHQLLLECAPSYVLMSYLSYPMSLCVCVLSVCMCVCACRGICVCMHVCGNLCASNPKTNTQHILYSDH